ncbi:unnamed protein product [Protopolystoma xenopodis]|uniref:Uncharacterized protein n=1 Tax=Protopolystoma xenopodis TaxID=117903 RepID=A0A448X7P7_9PLAT|nr:unnamed protein product [Protopolystoma xenopodis]
MSHLIFIFRGLQEKGPFYDGGNTHKKAYSTGQTILSMNRHFGRPKLSHQRLATRHQAAQHFQTRAVGAAEQGLRGTGPSPEMGPRDGHPHPMLIRCRKSAS